MDIPKGFTEVTDIPKGFSEVKDIPDGFSEVSDIPSGFSEVTPKGTTIREDVRAGVAGALGGIAGGLSGLSKLGAIPEQFFTGDVKHTTAISDSLEEDSKRLKAKAADIGKDQSFGGKLISMAASLPALPATLLTSPFDVQGEMLNAGESGLTASIGGEVMGAANLLGLKLPAAIGKTLATKVATGAGIGAGTDYLSKLALSNVAETPEMQKQFAPSWESAGLAALPGAALGAGVHVSDKMGKGSTPSKDPIADLGKADAGMTFEDHVNNSILAAQ